jgi:ArsR family transcriptional regulator, arsenate/arsenite/antimonite-responsive transcriptional repressor
MVEIFKALSEESRLRILSMLLNDEMCVCEIEACLKMSQSNVSRHLTTLKKSEIIESYKKAQWTYYRINKKFIEENNELWLYLEKRFKKLPFYNEDYEEYKKCKTQGLCNYNK